MTCVLLPESILQSICTYIIDMRTNNEHGCLLLGYRKNDDLQVETATFPQKWDYATPFLFQRSVRGHSLIAKKEWLRSEKTIDWIGEWHSHPVGFPYPSATDKKSWNQIVHKTNKKMLFVIFSGKELYVAIQKTSSINITQIHPKDYNEDFRLYG